MEVSSVHHRLQRMDPLGCLSHIGRPACTPVPQAETKQSTAAASSRRWCARTASGPSCRSARSAAEMASSGA